MEWLKHLFHQLTDVETMVRVGGLSAMTAIVFAETGLMVGFFLPGDSLLVTAGVFAAQGKSEHLVAEHSPRRRRHRGGHGRLLDRAEGRPGSLQPSPLPLLQPRAPEARPRFLREARRQDDHPRPLHADRPDVRAGRGRHGEDGVPPLRGVQRRRRVRVGRLDDPDRVLPGAVRLGEEEHRDRDRDRRVRVDPARVSSPPRGSG